MTNRDDLYKGPAAGWFARLWDRAKPSPEQVIKDGSWWKPDPATMPVSGFIGYLTRDTTGKRLTPAQCRAFLAAGKTLGLVGQDGKQQAKRGAAGGREDAIFYNAQADEDGAPPWLPLAYAVADYDASRYDLQGPIHSYVGAALDTIHARNLRPFAPYGGVRTIDYLGNAFGDQLAWYWQTVAWSGGAISPYAHLHQQAGAPWYPMSGPTDDNRLLKAIPRWGQREEYDVLSPDDVKLITGIRDGTNAAVQSVQTLHGDLTDARREILALRQEVARLRPHVVIDAGHPKRPYWFMPADLAHKVWEDNWHEVHTKMARLGIEPEVWTSADVAAVPTLPGTPEPPDA